MKVLILQHTDGEHPAAFSDLIAEAGDTAHIIRLHAGERIPSLSHFDAMIVMGGPMDVWQTQELPWLIAEKATIKAWVKAMRMPYLGICLGHQLLADALGGICETMPVPEIGVRNIEITPDGHGDPIFDGLSVPLPAMQWHGVEVTSLPEGATILAENDASRVQAMRIGENAWGVQFHPELTPKLVTGWLSDEGNYACAVDWLGSKEKATEFARDCEAHVDAARLQSRALYAALRNAAENATQRASRLMWEE